MKKITILLLGLTISLWGSSQQDCEHAIDLVPGTQVCDTNNYVDAQGSFPDNGDDPKNPCNKNYNDGEYWFKYTGNGKQLKLDISELSEEYSGIFILDDSPTNEGECIAGYIAGSSQDDYSITTPPLLTGHIYYIVIASWGPPDYTAFCLDATEIDVPTSYTCGDVFYDTGGDTANYSNGEDYWVKICGEASESVKLIFDKWTINDGDDDYMQIYDGDGISNNLLAYGDEYMPIPNTILSTGECLLVHWYSDRGGNSEGWKANVECFCHCQKVEYVWDGSTPAEDTDYITICPDTSIIFSAHGVYSENDKCYHQSDTTSLFVWDFGDNIKDTGLTVQHTYNEAKGYNVTLTVIDTIGCESRLFLNKRVRIAIPPTFNIYPEQTYLYKDDTTLIQNNQHKNSFEFVPEEFISTDIAPLPDFPGATYEFDIKLNHYAQTGTVLTDASQIESVSINIEHSYVRDLITSLICPNGTEVQLFNGNDYDGARYTYLGQPGSDDDDKFFIIGNGWDYIFSQNASIAFDDAPTTDEEIITLDGKDTSYSVKSGTYKPRGNFLDFVGCPINGTWTLRIKDDESHDDGYLFNWGIKFVDSLSIFKTWSYEMQIVDSSWISLDTSTIDTTVNPIKVVANKLGENRFKYTIVDQFGCSHDTTITIIGANVEFELSKEDVLCYATNTGKVHLNITKGTVSKYIWENPDGTTDSEESTEITKDWESLTAGTFTVTVEDAEGYSSVQSIEISEPDSLIINFDSLKELCSESSKVGINVSVSGGTPSYNYNWSGPNSYLSTDEDIIVSKAGYYKLIVKDANDCQIEDSIATSYKLPLEQSICIVTVDTATKTNLVVWERGNDHFVVQYNIYRKDITSDDYLLIDSVSVEDLTEYYDATANPNERSWKYKMSVKDSCGNESALSEYHKTIYLSMTEESDDIFKLDWDDYEGTDYLSVYVYRKIDNDAWKVLDSLSSDEHTYTDTVETDKEISYLVVVKMETSCDITSRGTRGLTTFGQFTSNIVVRAATTAVHNITNTNIQIYPNPTKGKIIIQGQDIVRVEVSTASGRKIRDIQSHSNKLKINLAKEPKGLYFVKVTAKQGVVLQKVVLE